MRKSTKFYRKNEQKVIEYLGLTPTKGSGSGWIEKGDGQNDNVVCELKSTNFQSIRVQKSDLDKVHEQALVANKVPVMAIQFIDDIGVGDVYLIMKPEDLKVISESIETGKTIEDIYDIPLTDEDDYSIVEAENRVINVIESAPGDREDYNSEIRARYNKMKGAL